MEYINLIKYLWSEATLKERIAGIWCAIAVPLFIVAVAAVTP